MKFEVKKEMFEAPIADVVLFESADVITSSPIDSGDHVFGGGFSFEF